MENMDLLQPTILRQQRLNMKRKRSHLPHLYRRDLSLHKHIPSQNQSQSLNKSLRFILLLIRQQI
jgi:hypothetical protein